MSCKNFKYCQRREHGNTALCRDSIESYYKLNKTFVCPTCHSAEQTTDFLAWLEKHGCHLTAFTKKKALVSKTVIPFIPTQSFVIHSPQQISMINEEDVTPINSTQLESEEYQQISSKLVNAVVSIQIIKESVSITQIVKMRHTITRSPSYDDEDWMEKIIIQPMNQPSPKMEQLEKKLYSLESLFTKYQEETQKEIRSLNRKVQFLETEVDLLRRYSRKLEKPSTSTIVPTVSFMEDIRLNSFPKGRILKRDSEKPHIPVLSKKRKE